MLRRLLASLVVCVLGSVASAFEAPTASAQKGAARRITWDDVTPLRARFEARGIPAVYFQAEIDRIRDQHAQRVREGDLDHLVFYLLQSTRFTRLPPIEPAISAKALVDSLEPGERKAFLNGTQPSASRVTAPVKARLAALMRALDSSSRDARLTYFRELVNATFPRRRDPSTLRQAQGRPEQRRGTTSSGSSRATSRDERETALLSEYLRVMRFVYEKEFVAQRSARRAEAVAELYRTRGLSTDTAVEAGYLVHLGLGVLKSLEPDRRIRRVLIVGPGLDLAPRTALRDEGPPESYQPWAVIDALLTLGLSYTDDLDVVAADINPRVVKHLRRSQDEPPTLTLVSEIQDSETVTLSEEYREYFGRLGHAIGDVEARGAIIDGAKGLLRKTVRVRQAAARALRAEMLDVVTERLQAPAFDLIVATNILPYFDDVELMLAMSNIAGMLTPGGVFLHNEARPLMHDVTAALGVPVEQSRHVTIASVRGAPAPLFDSVFLHRRNP